MKKSKLNEEEEEEKNQPQERTIETCLPCMARLS